MKKPGNQTSEIVNHKSKIVNLRAFTLVELLTVIAIIGILAAMLLPVLSKVKTSALVNKAKLEMGAIVTAVQGYDADNSRFPVSTLAQTAATAAGGDFTYGTTGAPIRGADGIPSATMVVLNNFSTTPAYETNNSEVVAILMDITNTAVTSVNMNHQKNPKQVKYLNASQTADPALPGVGPDLVYRDPWGNPYIISMDLNYDDQTRDAWYGMDKVSHGGLNGLINPDGASATSDKWQYRGKVMVWSAGPDRKIDSNSLANQGLNKDNVLTWQ